MDIRKAAAGGSYFEIDYTDFPCLEKSLKKTLLGHRSPVNPASAQTHTKMPLEIVCLR